MSEKWLGAIFIIGSCGGFGFSLASDYRKNERALRQLLRALSYMECELQYHLTPLPELCRQAAGETSGIVQDIFRRLGRELDHQTSPDVEICMKAVLQNTTSIPKTVKRHFKILGKTLGRFDLPGQLKGLEEAQASCKRELDAMKANQRDTLKSYQVLGLCAGAALAILFI